MSTNPLQIKATRRRKSSNIRLTNSNQSQFSVLSPQFSLSVTVKEVKRRYHSEKLIIPLLVCILLVIDYLIELSTASSISSLFSKSPIVFARAIDWERFPRSPSYFIQEWKQQHDAQSLLPDVALSPANPSLNDQEQKPFQFPREFLVVLQDGSLHGITADGEVRWSKCGALRSQPPELTSSSTKGIPTSTEGPTRRLLPGADGQIFYKGEDGVLIPLPINVRDIVFHSPFQTPLFPDVYFLGKRETVVESLDFYTGEPSYIATNATIKSMDEATPAESLLLASLDADKTRQLRIGQTRYVVRAMDLGSHSESWRLEWREVTPIINLGSAQQQYQSNFKSASSSSSSSSSHPFSPKDELRELGIAFAQTQPPATDRSITIVQQPFTALVESQLLSHRLAKKPDGSGGAIPVPVDGKSSNVAIVVDRQSVTLYTTNKLRGDTKSTDSESHRAGAGKVFQFHFPSNIMGVYSVRPQDVDHQDYLTLTLLMSASGDEQRISPEVLYKDRRWRSYFVPKSQSLSIPDLELRASFRRYIKPSGQFLSWFKPTLWKRFLEEEWHPRTEGRVISQVVRDHKGICPMETMAAVMGSECPPLGLYQNVVTPLGALETLVLEKTTNRLQQKEIFDTCVNNRPFTTTFFFFARSLLLDREFVLLLTFSLAHLFYWRFVSFPRVLATQHTNSSPSFYLPSTAFYQRQPTLPLLLYRRTTSDPVLSMGDSLLISEDDSDSSTYPPKRDGFSWKEGQDRLVCKRFMTRHFIGLHQHSSVTGATERTGRNEKKMQGASLSVQINRPRSLGDLMSVGEIERAQHHLTLEHRGSLLSEGNRPNKRGILKRSISQEKQKKRQNVSTSNGRMEDDHEEIHQETASFSQGVLSKLFLDESEHTRERLSHAIRQLTKTVGDNAESKAKDAKHILLQLDRELAKSCLAERKISRDRITTDELLDSSADKPLEESSIIPNSSLLSSFSSFSSHISSLPFLQQLNSVSLTTLQTNNYSRPRYHSDVPTPLSSSRSSKRRPRYQSDSFTVNRRTQMNYRDLHLQSMPKFEVFGTFKQKPPDHRSSTDLTSSYSEKDPICSPCPSSVGISMDYSVPLRGRLLSWTGERRLFSPFHSSPPTSSSRYRHRSFIERYRKLNHYQDSSESGPPTPRSAFDLLEKRSLSPRFDIQQCTTLNIEFEESARRKRQRTGSKTINNEDDLQLIGHTSPSRVEAAKQGLLLSPLPSSPVISSAVKRIPGTRVYPDYHPAVLYSKQHKILRHCATVSDQLILQSQYVSLYSDESSGKEYSGVSPVDNVRPYQQYQYQTFGSHPVYSMTLAEDTTDPILVTRPNFFKNSTNQYTKPIDSDITDDDNNNTKVPLFQPQPLVRLNHYRDSPAPQPFPFIGAPDVAALKRNLKLPFGSPKPVLSLAVLPEKLPYSPCDMLLTKEMEGQLSSRGPSSPKVSSNPHISPKRSKEETTTPLFSPSLCRSDGDQLKASVLGHQLYQSPFNHYSDTVDGEGVCMSSVQPLVLTAGVDEASSRNESVTLPPVPLKQSPPCSLSESHSSRPPVSRIPTDSILSSFVENGKFYRTFKDLQLIGKGGFGSVYKVRHRFEPDFPEYAVKFVSLRLKASENVAKRRYFREISANRDLFSRHIVRYFTWWCEEPQFLPPCGGFAPEVPTLDNEGPFHNSDGKSVDSALSSDQATRVNNKWRRRLRACQVAADVVRVKTRTRKRNNIPIRVNAECNKEEPSIAKESMDRYSINHWLCNKQRSSERPRLVKYTHKKQMSGREAEWAPFTDSSSSLSSSEVSSSCGRQQYRHSHGLLDWKRHRHHHGKDETLEAQTSKTLKEYNRSQHFQGNGLSSSLLDEESYTSTLNHSKTLPNGVLLDHCNEDEDDFIVFVDSDDNQNNMRYTNVKNQQIHGKRKIDGEDLGCNHTVSSRLRNEGGITSRHSSSRLLSSHNCQTRQQRQLSPLPSKITNRTSSNDFRCVIRRTRTRRKTSGNRVVRARGGGNKQLSRGFNANPLIGTTNEDEPTYSVVLLIQMELISGMTLRQWLDRPERTVNPEAIVAAFSNYKNSRLGNLVDGKSKRLFPPTEIAFFRQLIKGLKDIHRHGIVHRDIKPENIYINHRPPLLKIGDFGLARFIEAKTTINTATASGGSQSHTIGTPASSVLGGTQTQLCGSAAAAAVQISMENRDIKRVDSVVSVKGLVIGTPGYTAPEGGALCTEKADVFSAALILLELLCPRFGTAMERYKTLENFRTRQKVPEHIAMNLVPWSELMKKMGSPNPKERPSADAIYKSIKVRLQLSSITDGFPEASHPSSGLLGRPLSFDKYRLGAQIDSSADH